MSGRPRCWWGSWMQAQCWLSMSLHLKVATPHHDCDQPFQPIIHDSSLSLSPCPSVYPSLLLCLSFSFFFSFSFSLIISCMLCHESFIICLVHAILIPTHLHMHALMCHVGTDEYETKRTVRDVDMTMTFVDTSGWMPLWFALYRQQTSCLIGHYPPFTLSRLFCLFLSHSTPMCLFLFSLLLILFIYCFILFHAGRERGVDGHVGGVSAECWLICSRVLTQQHQVIHGSQGHLCCRNGNQHFSLMITFEDNSLSCWLFFHWSNATTWHHRHFGIAIKLFK